MPTNSGTKRIRFLPSSDRDFSLYVRVRVVFLYREVFIAKSEYVFHGRIDPHCRQAPRRARQLQARLFQMIEIEMSIAECVNEVAWLIACHLRHHHCEQRIGGDIEWHTEKNIR